MAKSFRGSNPRDPRSPCRPRVRQGLRGLLVHDEAERPVAYTVVGNPDPLHVSISYVERQNLTMRMRMRRFIRLTNAFSKKLENLEHAVAIHYMHYNSARFHQTLKSTPAMRAKVTDHLWDIQEIVNLSR
jgi:hypothetical protein